MNDVFEEALHFAIYAHSGMVRRSARSPYIVHPLEVVSICATMTSDHEVLAAAVLHDVVEDAGVTLEELEERFGEHVAELVAAETEDKRHDLPPEETWRIRKEESLEKLASSGRDEKIIWLGDKLSNMRSYGRLKLEQGNDFWKYFNQTDPEQQYWYYDTIRSLTSELSDEAAWKEFNQLLIYVFDEEERGA